MIQPYQQNIKQLANLMKCMRNPQAYIEQQVNSNPQFKAIMDSSNGDYETAFKNMCKQMNVNPDDILDMLK